MGFLKNRYVYILIIFLAIFIAGNMILNAGNTYTYVFDIVKNDILRQAQSLSAEFSTKVNDPQDIDQVKRWLEDIESNQPFIAEFITENGDVFGTQINDNKTFSVEEQNAVDSAFSGQSRILDIFDPQLNILQIITFTPLTTTNDKTIAVLKLSQPHTYAEHNANDSILYLKRSWMVASGLAALITILILFITTRPIRRLTEQLKSLPTSQVYHPIPTERQDDIGRLIWSLNHLFAQFNQQTSVLRNETIKRNSILKNMSDGMIIVNEEDIVEEMNLEAQRIFEIDESEAIGLTLVEVVRHHKLIELHHTCKQNRKQESITFETIPNKLFLHAVASPLQPPLEGYTLLVIQDLTRLRHLEMVRKDFVSNVSHELRTPIASIKALTETLSEGAIDDPQHARRFLSMMEGEIDNINQMVQELLELSRIEAGKAVLDRAGIEPQALISKAYERMLIQSERANLYLIQNYPDDLPPVFADANKVGQVFINLIHNAIKFSSPEGKIILSARVDRNRVIFSVEDEGIGIEPQNLTRIFERFYKEDQARSGQGTGLGLAIAKHIIESHGGRIWAENKSPHGSIFSFSLPIQ